MYTGVVPSTYPIRFKADQLPTYQFGYAAHPRRTHQLPASTGENGNGDHVSVAEIEPMLVDSDAGNGKNGDREDDSRGGQGGNGEVEDPSQRWRALEKLVSRPSPFGAETGQLAVGEFEPFENVSSWTTDSKGVHIRRHTHHRNTGESRGDHATLVESIGGEKGVAWCWLPVNQGL